MGVVSDEFWAAVESVMPSDEGKRGNRFSDHRWSLDGTYDKMFAQVAEAFGMDAEMVEDLEKLLSVDSTSVRAHQHSAGARSDTLATGGSVELQESA